MNYRKTLTAALLLAASLSATALHAEDVMWRSVSQSSLPERSALAIKPARGAVSSVSSALLQAQLWGATTTTAVEISLPMPNGSMRVFRVWDAPVMQEQLAHKYAGIRTFRAVAKDNPSVTAKLDYTEKGFHAMIHDGKNIIFIDPYDRGTTSLYTSYYKHDYNRTSGQRMICDVADPVFDELGEGFTSLTPNGLPSMRILGGMHRTYRLALACTEEYAVAVDGSAPTKAGVLSAMVTSVNRVNSVYEQDFAVTMSIIGANDTLIFLPGDPSEPYDNFDGGAMLGQNQTTVDDRIGISNYDIGHVFSTGGGGIANLGCVCSNFEKAEGVTGGFNPVGDPFDIDYVAHEIGHQFGGSHTFNANTGSCNGNGSANSSYEPGSGSTIMAYAGICDYQDLQPHSDVYFHARSLDQMGRYIDSLDGSTCPVTVASGNNPPVIPAYSASYEVPSLTPFELIAPAAIDADHDTLTYCWEQWNRGTNQGDFGKDFEDTRIQGPIFRSFYPTTDTVRVFPRIDSVVRGVTKYFGEKVPDTNRMLRFRLTVRDMLNGIGSFNFSTDTVVLNVHHTGVPFTVTSPDTAGTIWHRDSTYNVTWDVAGTAAAPVSCSAVDIYLSVDSGYTYPYLLLANTPNDGGEVVTIPNIPITTGARIKVKGHDNVFFNLNPVNFTIDTLTPPPSGIASATAMANEVTVYPVPATKSITVNAKAGMSFNSRLLNAIGQQVWAGTVTNNSTISVQQLAKGIYYLHLADVATGTKLTKQVVVQ